MCILVTCYLPGGAGNRRFVTAGLLRSDNEQALRKELLLSKLLGSVLLGRLLTSPSTKNTEKYIQNYIILKVFCKLNISNDPERFIPEPVEIPATKIDFGK